MNIIYTNSEGVLVIFTPSQEAKDLLTLEEIAKRVVPAGLKYWFSSLADLPQDRSYRDAWQIDEAVMGKPDGYGV